MKARRALGIITLLLVGLAPVAALVASRGRAPAAAIGEERVSCTYPASEWMHPEWPPPQSGEEDPWLDPAANSILRISEIQGVSGNLATMRVARIEWESESTSPEQVALEDALQGKGQVIGVASVPELWDSVGKSLTSHDNVLIGVSSQNNVSGVNVSWAMTDDGAFLGADPYWTRATLMLEYFLGRYEPSQTPLGLIENWNIEMQRSGTGPVLSSWETFLRKDVIRQAAQVGTLGWWNAVDPRCRSVSDAPPEILAGLTSRDAVLSLPPAWLGIKDLSACLSTDLGSLGCTDVSGKGHVLVGDVLVASGQTLEVKLAREQGGTVGFDNLIWIGSLDSHVFDETGWAEIQVTSDFEPASFSDLDGAPAPTLRAGSILEADAGKLLLNAVGT